MVEKVGGEKFMYETRSWPRWKACLLAERRNDKEF
jgi:hypothetical protein